MISSMDSLQKLKWKPLIKQIWRNKYLFTIIIEILCEHDRTNIMIIMIFLFSL